MMNTIKSLQLPLNINLPSRVKAPSEDTDVSSLSNSSNASCQKMDVADARQLSPIFLPLLSSNFFSTIATSQVEPVKPLYAIHVLPTSDSSSSSPLSLSWSTRQCTPTFPLVSINRGHNIPPSPPPLTTAFNLVTQDIPVKLSPLFKPNLKSQLFHNKPVKSSTLLTTQVSTCFRNGGNLTPKWVEEEEYCNRWNGLVQETLNEKGNHVDEWSDEDMNHCQEKVELDQVHFEVNIIDSMFHSSTQNNDILMNVF